MMEFFTDSWDRDWMGKEVDIYTSDEQVFSGTLADFGRHYVEIDEIEKAKKTRYVINTDHIVAICLPKIDKDVVAKHNTFKKEGVWNVVSAAEKLVKTA